MHIPLDSVFAGVAEAAWNEALTAPIVETDGPDVWLSQVRSRDVHFAAAAIPMIESAVDTHGEHVIVDGVLWPQDVQRLRCRWSAICLVDTSDHADRLVKLSESDGHLNNWHRERAWTAERISRWARLNAYRSEAYKSLCVALNVPVIDIGDFESIEVASDAGWAAAMASLETGCP